jgi:hypothetical protein
MKLPKIKMPDLTKPQQGGIVLLAVITGALLAYGVVHLQLNQTIQLLTQQVLQLDAKQQSQGLLLAEASKNNDYLSAEMAVEKSTNQLLLADLKAEQQKTFELKQQLAIYEKIVKPEQAVSTLILDSFSVSSGSAAGSFKYSVLVIEQDKKKKSVKGQIELVAVGKKKGKKLRVDLLKLAGIKPKARSYTLKHFKSFEGEFVLPAGFKPETVELKISTPRAKINRVLKWSEIGEILD